MSKYIPMSTLSDEIYEPVKPMNTYRKFNIIYKIGFFVITFAISVILIIIMLDMKTKINVLTETTTAIINEHNKTIANLEKLAQEFIILQNQSLLRLERDMGETVQLLNFVLINLNSILNNYNNNFNTPEVTKQILKIIGNIQNITTDIDAKTFQKDIHEIACDLAKILNREIPNCSDRKRQY